MYTRRQIYTHLYLHSYVHTYTQMYRHEWIHTTRVYDPGSMSPIVLLLSEMEVSNKRSPPIFSHCDLKL